jgi:hypothetical protein
LEPGGVQAVSSVHSRNTVTLTGCASRIILAVAIAPERGLRSLG